MMLRLQDGGTGVETVPTIDPDLVDRLLAHATVSAGAARHTVLAPFTGKRLYDLPLSSDGDLDAAMLTLRQGQRAWAARPLAERARIMLRFHDLVLEHRNEGLDIVQWETGKARRDAMMELLDVCLNARHYARDARRLLSPRRHRGIFPLAVGVVQYQVPKGVVGVLTPWNYPLTLAASDSIPALMAGNAVLLKPDLQTTLTALWLVGLMIRAGVPESAVRVVTGDGPEIGPKVIDRVDYVMYTGSTRAGREVAARCGERLIGCSLELGGKNAMIVREDAPIAKAAEIAERACFSNAGQLCISMERIYVHEAVADEFTAAFVERVRAMRMVAEVGWGAEMGSLTFARQRDRTLAHIADAVAKGATVLTGGNARPEIGPFFVEPTVLAGVTDDMDVCADETFGPVVAIYPVASDEEAVARANDTEYGLNAAVVTRDLAEGQAMARRLRSGTVNINEGYGPSWGSTRAPMGGMNASGLGRRHGDEGLLKYTDSQTVATQRFLGFGRQFGLDDEQWLDLMRVTFSAFKAIGMK